MSRRRSRPPRCSAPSSSTWSIPTNPSPQRLAAGAVLHVEQRQHRGQHGVREPRRRARQIDPAKLNAVLSALAEGVRGQGERIGQATTDANQVLLALNPRSETIRADWQALKSFSDTYSAAAQDILTILDAASTTSATITNHAAALDDVAAHRDRLLQHRDRTCSRRARPTWSRPSTSSSRRRTC